MIALARFAHTRRFLTLLCAALVAGSLAAVGLNISIANSSGGEVREVNEQGWSYELQIKDSHLEMVTISYTTNSAAGVEAYAAAQRQENLQLFKQGVEEVKAVSLVFN